MTDVLSHDGPDRDLTRARDAVRCLAPDQRERCEALVDDLCAALDAVEDEVARAAVRLASVLARAGRTGNLQ